MFGRRSKMSNPQAEVLGIVGMRSGSKGVPDKNLRPLAGRPLVGWILNASRQAKLLTRVIVSTDSAEYASVARSFGAETPCLRPADLSGDTAPDYDYVRHMLDWLDEHEGYRPNIVVKLTATVPLQSADDIDAVISIVTADPSADSAVVIAEARQHPLKALKIVDDGEGGRKLVTYFTNSGREVTPIARQHYEKAYFRANVIACRRRVIFDTGSLTGDLVRFHVIPQERAVDIDSLTDFYVVEQLMKKGGA